MHRLYVLDEPIGGVDPAAMRLYSPDHPDKLQRRCVCFDLYPFDRRCRNVLDRVLFLQNGQITLNASVDEIRSGHKKSVDALFREVFRC